jgi:hypothetical protein
MDAGFVVGRRVRWQIDNQVRFSGDRVLQFWNPTPAERCTTCAFVLIRTKGGA